MLRVSLTCVEQQFGPWSIEMANELQKYTDVLLELGNNKGKGEALERLLDDALLIYRIHYGTWSRGYKEAQLKKSRLISSSSVS